MCKQTYHMNCVQPPLLKKPARGFGWSCGPCSRKQERKLEARNTPLVGEKAIEQEEVFEEEEEHAANSNPTNGSTPGISDDHQEVRKATKEQIAQAKLWPYRYLGIHCKVEDALDYDDRIYPRASSRLGPRHQANVLAWHDHCVEYIKPAEIKRKYIKSGHKKDTKLTKETVAALEADKVAREKRPKWVLDEPAGFVHRGDDHPNDSSASTAKIVFRLPKVGESSSRGDDLADGQGVEDRETIIDKYMAKARKIAPSLGLEAYHTNFLDKAIELLYANNFNMDVALKQLQNIDLRKDLKEPKLSKEELRKFEEGVAKYGSSLADVSRHIGRGVKHGDIVRFYYGWKKSDKGKQIWGSYEGRKSKKQAKNSDTALLDVVADDIDDSAFDNEKAAKRKRGFECKFCSTRQSRFWRRAPLTQPGTTVAVESGNKTSKDKSQQFMVALCQRCAGLWRKYAIQWENIDDVAKKVSSTGGRAFKKKIDEELLIELVHANEASSVAMSQTAVAAAQTLGVDVPTSLTIQPEDGSRKKARLSTEKENSQQPIHSEPPKKRVIEKPVEPPLVPEQPKFKTLPCAVCNEMEPTGSEHFTCRHCRLTVHRNCYGIPEGRSANKWICDMCSNDSTNQYSTNYECVLCPVQYNEFDLFEPPRATHKKKSDREREKERLEKELVVEATVSYQKKKEELGRPIFPREPLKPTAGNKWVHVVCAVWTPWIRFKDAGTLEKAEGILSIPASKFKQVCKYCKTDVGVCVTCHKCPHTFHVTCAQQYGLSMGFDVTPVKSSRRDVVNTVTLGNETGTAEAVVYCKDHPPKNILHLPNEAVEESSLNALQIFVQSFKQSDSLLTGTVRKAAIINSSRTNTINNAVTANGHRGSISNGSGGTASRSLRASPAAVTVKSEEVDEDGDRIVYLDNTTPEPSVKQCYLCESNTSPKWYKKPSKRPENGALEAAALTEARSEAAPAYHCHKCDLSVRARKEASAAAKPKPVVSERLPSRELVPAESQVTQVAPSPNPIWQAPAPPPQHPGHWPTQAPPSNPPPPLVNGVSHTPPAHSIPLVQSPYAAPPPPTQPLSPYYSNGYERREPPPIQHQVNGAPSPYMARRPSGPREQLVYAHPPPPPPPPPHLSSPQFGHPIVNGAHSPPTGYRVNQGPSGPLRAAENPFFQPQRSPTQHYRGPHESPRSRNDPRPLTPGNSSGRSSAWERDRERERERERDRERERERTESQMANGASASPSLRNLLH